MSRYLKNRLLSFSTLFLVVLMAAGMNTTQTIATPTAGAQCSTPTQTVTITADDTSYDKSSLEVAKATCVQIKLINNDLIDHDFTIDGKSGMETVFAFATAGETVTFNVTTPDADITFEFYCFQPGHKAAGMVGDFKVGEGSAEEDSPSFGFWLTLTAFLSLVLITPKMRK